MKRLPSEELELFREPDEEAATGPRVLAVAGAKGGVGKTLLAANLGVYLATIGRRVVAADADPAGANLHGFLGAEHPAGVARYVPPLPEYVQADDEDGDPQEQLAFDSGSFDLALDDDEDDRDTVPPPGDMVALGVPGLHLLHAGIDEPARGHRRRARRGKLLERLRGLDADYVVVDLGAGTHRSLLDCFLQADVGVFMTLPEPTAMEGTYRFVRAIFARQLLGLARDPEERRALLAELRTHDNAPPPLDLLADLRAASSPLVERVEETIERFRFPFVVNQTRLRADLELGDFVESAARRRLGLRLDYMGYIDTDDTVWNTLRAGRPLLVESPGTKASRNIEKIARRLLAIDAGKRRRSPLPQVPPHTHHDLLEVDRGATDEEVRRAYKRAREIYAPGSLACRGLFDDEGLERLRARVEEAHDVLLDPARRRPYELSVFPPEPERPSEQPEEQAGPRPPAPVITPETDFTGPLLRAVRESQGVTLSDVSGKTKIGRPFLVAIEDDAFAALPALVYVRGFVTEIAKHLGLDPEHVARTYVRRYRRWMEERERA